MTAAVAAMYTEHRAEMLSYAGSLLGNLNDAEDVVQDALLAALRTGVEPDCAEAWLRVAIRRLIHDRWRHRQRRSDPAWQAQLPSSILADHADQVASAVDAQRATRGVLGRLDHRHRDVFELRHVHDYSLDETAAALGVPRGTVKSRTSRAARLLRAAVTEASR